MKVVNTIVKDAREVVAAEVERYSKGNCFKEIVAGGFCYIWRSEKYPHKRVRIAPPQSENQKKYGSWSITHEVWKESHGPWSSSAVDEHWGWVLYTGAPMSLDHGLSHLRSKLAEASFFLAREGE